MNKNPQPIDLQIDHPEVNDLQEGFQAGSLKKHILSLIHRYPYEQLLDQASGKDVLELGCNKGYGTVIYAEATNHVKAVDTSSEAIDQAQKINARDNAEFICLHSWTLPFEDDTFDMTVLFQVIEHIALDKLDIFLREIRRVTRADGQVIFTTPNRKIRLLPFQKPRNEFHVKEYSSDELDHLLRRYFPEVTVDGLFGPEELNRIERKRVKQKPAKVYIKEPVRKFLIRPLLSLFSSGREVSSRPKKPHVETADAAGGSAKTEYPYTLSDLEYRSDSLNQTLDLRAVVKRVK